MNDQKKNHEDKINSLFEKAYSYHVVEDKQIEAAQLCKDILKIDPMHHNARVLLGIILADYGNKSEIIESNMHFVNLIKQYKNIRELLFNRWEEEDPIYQLSISEEKNKKPFSLALLLFVDYLLSNKEYPINYIKSILKKTAPDSEEILLYLMKKIKEKFDE